MATATRQQRHDAARKEKRAARERDVRFLWWLERCTRRSVRNAVKAQLVGNVRVAKALRARAVLTWTEYRAARRQLGLSNCGLPINPNKGGFAPFED